MSTLRLCNKRSDYHNVLIQQEPSLSIKKASLKNLAAYRVLIVEDDLISQRVAQLAIENLGFKSDVASCGQEALTCFANNTYQFILLDIGLPDLSGIEISQRIRLIDKKIPIVALTAHGEWAKPACLAAGMNDLLSKPILLNKLEETMQYWLLKHNPNI